MKRSRRRPALLARTKPANPSEDDLLSVTFARENLCSAIKKATIAAGFLRQLAESRDQRIRAFGARIVAATSHSRKRLDHLQAVLKQLEDEHEPVFPPEPKENAWPTEPATS